MKVFFFLLFVGANFVWMLITVGALMAWLMPRTKNRNNIILCVSFVLGVLVTLFAIKTGPGFDDSIYTNCRSSSHYDGC